MGTVTHLAAGLLALGIAGPAAAHEHMYIGSDRPHGGALVLSYDFTRKFPLVPDPSGVGFIGTDPAFNAQVTDDPANGIYRLRNHTPVKMQITAIDPQVSVNLNGAKLTKPGDTAKIGKMPYLHQHPDWLLNVPSNVMGDYHLSFRVMAPGYHPSASYSATMTNVAAPTTITIPGQTCAPGACEDHDPCTIDRCVAGSCQHDPSTGIDAVTCRLGPLSDALDDARPTTRPGQRIVHRMFGVFNAVAEALRSLDAGEADAPRKLKGAVKQLNRFAAMVDRAARVNGVTPAEADTLRTLAGNVYDQLVLLTP